MRSCHLSDGDPSVADAGREGVASCGVRAAMRGGCGTGGKSNQEEDLELQYGSLCLPR